LILFRPFLLSLSLFLFSFFADNLNRYDEGTHAQVSMTENHTLPADGVCVLILACLQAFFWVHDHTAS
ncbi:hypothetical protein, partial [Dictyobacter arantiisoli]|uniref:hypothetical protein n=1 Tax=Dictyobacter arantiisoli TaxID=2014874 RepID=UPI001C0EC51D